MRYQLRYSPLEIQIRMSKIIYRVSDLHSTTKTGVCQLFLDHFKIVSNAMRRFSESHFTKINGLNRLVRHFVYNVIAIEVERSAAVERPEKALERGLVVEVENSVGILDFHVCVSFVSIDDNIVSQCG